VQLDAGCGGNRFAFVDEVVDEVAQVEPFLRLGEVEVVRLRR
jgi:hypothetical protein